MSWQKQEIRTDESTSAQTWMMRLIERVSAGIPDTVLTFEILQTCFFWSFIVTTTDNLFYNFKYWKPVKLKPYSILVGGNCWQLNGDCIYLTRNPESTSTFTIPVSSLVPPPPQQGDSTEDAESLFVRISNWSMSSIQESHDGQPIEERVSLGNVWFMHKGFKKLP